ncbi:MULTISPECIES: YibE/F family protein [unclassified Oceanispirochaeta]|uniref:YibE/F family protein n=1 Tax=unclassified Oceanispirochaeta TaxID=2635722 RepID=UPI000E091EB7|nr:MULTISPECIES: YibE/F family protein [unclassified Oceanispirochaeta]MBF9017723.1 YibE/F family protein [Oceanispirochaeta sp. M2]NPD72126.1 YibE/F family protein [Oceanispirochaeta sp. M1]RDG32568.1 YibE/F family protein [Oceanispirochaeta sp. M1]
MWDLPNKDNKKDIIFVILTLILTVGLFFLPNEFQRDAYPNSVRVKGRIINTDNSGVQQFGLVRQGDQLVTVEVLNKEYKGKILEAGNILIGTLEMDKIFEVGDTALVVLTINPETGKIITGVAYDHYRLDSEIYLLSLFVFLLLAYAQWTGLKALLSFAFTGTVIWKVLLPGYLRGWDPVVLALSVTAVLTGVIIFLIAGINKKGLTAFLGGFLGIVLTAILSMLFTRDFKIHGAVVKFSETLLYSGYAHLNLTKIFQAGIFLAASGAVMDLAMDISASMKELVDRHPGISRKELLLSGFRVGRAVLGTMTTTLLLAYSSGYAAMIMVFIAQGTPPENVFNITYVSAEILQTLVGSFGLVTVAPFTALMGALIYSERKDRTI